MTIECFDRLIGFIAGVSAMALVMALVEYVGGF
jgi:hypothetical protein